jgi:radical SAM protein with 4Fe4S-binding SPASM domain
MRKYSTIPDLIRMDLTSRCNLDCDICYASGKQLPELSTDKILLIIDKIKEFGVKTIIFSGGEPFLRQDLEEIIKYAYDRGIKCEIVTNATLIQEKHIDFIKSYVSDLSISLDGHNEKINRKTRGKGSFKKVIKTIRLLKKGKIDFDIITVVSKANIKFIDDIIEFGRKMGAREHSFARFVPLGSGSQHKNLHLPDKEWINLIKEFDKNDRLNFDKKYITGRCEVCRKLLCILSNGDIAVCTRKYKKEWILGNMFKDSLKNVWINSPILARVRNKDRINCIDCDF